MHTDNGRWERLRAELIQAGKKIDPALIDGIKSLGPAVVPALLELATDKALYDARQANATVWAPLHAIWLLGELEAAAAIDTLLSMLVSPDDDVELAWMVEVALGKIGRAALTPLRALLFGHSPEVTARNRAADALKQVGSLHPELHAEVVEMLTARLAAPETQTPEDEALNGVIISSLLDLKALDALPAIRQAFDEDRVDTFVLEFADVQRGFDLPGAPPLPEINFDPTRRKTELKLRLKCTVCGAERLHIVGRVYCDVATLERRGAGEHTAYSEYIIPTRIVCPKCGAIDQYELTNMALLVLRAELMAEIARRKASDEEEGPLVFKRWVIAGGREVHPYEARDIYRRQVEAAPDNPELRVRFGNVLAFLGYGDEAIAEYRAAMECDSTNIEAAYNLGNAMREAGDMGEARRLFEHVLATAARCSLPRDERDAIVLGARHALVDPSKPPGGHRIKLPKAPLAAGLTGSLGGQRASNPVEKVGRNEPCPCGSGLKYKKCHGC
jgi:tetratricopeptide (TPR) repeat protein